MTSSRDDGAAMAGMATAVRHDLRSRRRWQATCLAALALLGALAVVAGAVGVLPGEPGLRDELLTWSTPAVRVVARIVNHGGSWHALLPGMLLVFALAPEARRRWWLWSAVLVAGAIVEGALKSGLARARPEDVSSGFPSGHATAAAAFAVIVVYQLGRARLSPRARGALAGVVLAGAAFVGLARIELRAHWPSDVVAGWALGTAAAAGAAWWDLALRARTAAPAAGRRLDRVPADPRAARG